jgi:hypothetical protein
MAGLDVWNAVASQKGKFRRHNLFHQPVSNARLVPDPTPKLAANLCNSAPFPYLRVVVR